VIDVLGAEEEEGADGCTADEVESLLPSRMKAIGGGEPNDGIRVKT